MRLRRLLLAVLSFAIASAEARIGGNARSDPRITDEAEFASVRRTVAEALEGVRGQDEGEGTETEEEKSVDPSQGNHRLDESARQPHGDKLENPDGRRGAAAAASRDGNFEDDSSRRPDAEERTATEESTPESKESRTAGEAIAEPREQDFIDAEDFGLRAMSDLYSVLEPKLYAMGLFLNPNNPARYVAAFNAQTEEAKHLAKFGYAALEAARKFHSKFPDILRHVSNFQRPEKTTLRQQCPKRGVPQCTPASLKYRTADGSCNNRKELWWGSAMSTMQRFLPAVYEDGIQSPRRSVTAGSLLPSARLISDYIHQERDAPLVSVTHMLMQWGQFIDHDITATGQSRAFNGTVPQCCLNNGGGFQPSEFMHPECMPISVHPQDRHLGRLGVRCLEFVRSGPAPKEDCGFGPREQLSQVTSFIDASTVYSSNAQQSDSLRLFRNGLLQYGKLQSRRPVLPREDSDLCRRGSLSTNCFKAGDIRLSEQPALISLHVVFLRLHNRLATQLAALNQEWSDEKIFQESRKIVGAIIQHITYREFLPIILGHEVLKIFDIELRKKGYYEGYDETIEPNIANAFSTAAYRFGHSLVQHSFVRYDKNHQPIFNNVTIHDEFTNPVNLETAGSVDRILLGLINQEAQKRDEYISEELTNHLFQTPGFPFGMDLAALNIQRGRDHGIPPYINWREPCSLSRIRNWNDLNRIMSADTVKKLQDIYTSISDIDLFSAGLAEKPVFGGLVGPTFACIIAQQFRNLRKGDRFWYENPFIENGFTLTQLEQIRKVTLAQILCRTLDNIDNIQPLVMLAADNLRNQRIACEDPLLTQINLKPWIERFSRQRSNDKTEIHLDDVEVESRTSGKVKIQNSSQKQKPTKTRINQQNRIVVQRPLAPSENLTIVVHNHAVHSPVFVSDSIYGSNFNIGKMPSLGLTPYHPSHPQATTSNYGYNQSPSTGYSQKPIQKPYSSLNTYYPNNFADPSNPNPPNYGFSEKPLNNNFPNNEFFSYNMLIPLDNRPTLEQYSFNRLQPGSQYLNPRPNLTHSVSTQSYSDNYGPSPSEGSYNENTNRYPQSNYPSRPYFEPNKSDRDELYTRPTKQPAQPNQNNQNQHRKKIKISTESNHSPTIPYQTKRTSVKPNHYYLTTSGSINPSSPIKYLAYGSQVEKWENSKYPESFKYGDSYESSNVPRKEPNKYNFSLLQEDDQVPHYLHTHTTLSDVKFVSSNEQQINQFDLELPRPIKLSQNLNEGYEEKSRSKDYFETNHESISINTHKGSITSKNTRPTENIISATTSTSITIENQTSGPTMISSSFKNNFKTDVNNISKIISTSGESAHLTTTSDLSKPLSIGHGS